MSKIDSVLAFKKSATPYKQSSRLSSTARSASD